MTTEKIIKIPREINHNGIVTQNLSKEDAIDNQTDLLASIKLIDAMGNTIFLIETMPINADGKFDKGCFIRRFEYNKNISGLLLDMGMKAFRTCVKCEMVKNDLGLIEFKYNHLWVQMPNTYLKESIFSRMEWNQVLNDGNYSTMIAEWNV